MKNFEKFMERIDDAPYGELDCEGFLKNVYQDKNFECPSYDCYVCLAKAMKYLNEEYKEPIHLTHDEYVILKSVSDIFTYIRRKKCYNGARLELCRANPIIFTGIENFYRNFDMYDHLFSFIDAEPYEISKLIEDYEKEHEDDN